jgi:hypothetical protein
MSRASVLLATLTDDPQSTSELYDRVGYLTLTRLGLVPYHAFRAELERLAASGSVACETGADGSTLWRRAPASADPDGRTLD